jgi:cell wall-associated NlpC family hydrolase
MSSLAAPGTSLLDRLPRPFAAVRYSGARLPDGVNALDDGANCQRYAYAVLAQFGIGLPPWRSSELWADEALTERHARGFAPLDLLLFSPDGDAFGAHVGVYAGEGQVLHLAKSVGRPALWTLAEFAERPEYRILLGAKRARHQR